MKTVIATSSDEFDKVRDAWRELRQRHSRPIPNADPRRFEVTLGCMGQSVSPYVAILSDEAGPQAAIVGRMSLRPNVFRVGYLKVPAPTLRCLDVVYGGLICGEQAAVRQAVSEHLRAMLRKGRVDSISMNHLPLQHPLYDALSAGGAGAGSCELHWTFNLVPGSYDETISGFSTKHRGNIRRADQKLVKQFDGDVVLRRFDQTEQVGEFARGAAAIAARTYQAGLGVAFTDSELWDAVLRLEAGRGQMRCYWLECGGTPVAFQVGGTYDGIYFLEALGFDPDLGRLRPGFVLHHRVVRDLAESGMRQIDYGFGDAEYKRICGSESWEETTLTLYRNGLKPTIVQLVDRSTAAMTRGAKRVSNAAGFLKSFKKSWRHRLARRAQTTEASDRPRGS